MNFRFGLIGSVILWLGEIARSRNRLFKVYSEGLERLTQIELGSYR
jgi:hypothetical protein